MVFNIMDFNDCRPEFLNPPLRTLVAEDALNNSVLERYSVRDCDSGLNGVDGTRFSIVTGKSQDQGIIVSRMSDCTLIL